MKSLFLYYLKKRIPTLLIFGFITLLITVVITATTVMAHRVILHNGGTSTYVSSTHLFYLSTLLVILASIIPIYEFAFKMRKTSVDLFYSLPIKRTKLYTTKYLIGLLELFILFTFNFLYVLIFASINMAQYDVTFKLIYFLPYYFSMLGLGFLLYNWVSFFFTRGNTILDGIILTILSIFVVTLLASFAYAIKNKIESPEYRVYTGEAFNFTAYSLVYNVTSIFDSLVKANYKGELTLHLVSFVVMMVVSISFVPLFFILNNKKKAEDTADINKEWYLYKLFIPLYIICIYSTISTHPFYMILVPIAGYVGYVINNRSFLIKKYDLILLISSTLIGAIGGILMNVYISI